MEFEIEHHLVTPEVEYGVFKSTQILALHLYL